MIHEIEVDGDAREDGVRCPFCGARCLLASPGCSSCGATATTTVAFEWDDGDGLDAAPETAADGGADAKPCPACGHMAPWDDFKRAGGCPDCERNLTTLLDMAAGDA